MLLKTLVDSIAVELGELDRRGFLAMEQKKPGRVGRLPETNSKFVPDNGWLEYYIISFWDGLYSGANC